MSIRVLVADNNALFRRGIKGVLEFEPDIDVVGETINGQETLAKTLVLQPDVLLLNLNLPGVSGMDVCRQLVNDKCHAKIIAMDEHNNDDHVLEAVKNGAEGYLLKSVEPSVLLVAIRNVAEGEFFLLPELQKRLFGSLKPNDNVQEAARTIWKEGRGERLTAREMEVLACIARGCSNQDIAQALFVSEKTVKNHLTNIFRKLNVNDRTQALIYVLKHNIMTLE